MTARFSWNQGKTRGHRPRLQDIRDVHPKLERLMPKILTSAVLAFAVLSFVEAFAQRSGVAAEPGIVNVEPPTTGALGLEWRIQGDDNRNASVALAWKRTGETAFLDGLPLFRLQGEA